MRVTLQKRKQSLVRDAIWDAAITLFDKKGFDRTTVDDIAKATGVSRRSFFRYFASKDDLLAQGVVSYGEWLEQAIAACPRTCSPAKVIRAVTSEIAEQIAAHPRTRMVLRITERSHAARQAQDSALAEVEDRVTRAFAARRKKKSKNDLQPRLLALLTLSILKAAIAVWAKKQRQDMSAIIGQALPTLVQALS